MLFLAGQHSITFCVIGQKAVTASYSHTNGCMPDHGLAHAKIGSRSLKMSWRSAKLRLLRNSMYRDPKLSSCVATAQELVSHTVCCSAPGGTRRRRCGQCVARPAAAGSPVPRRRDRHPRRCCWRWSQVLPPARCGSVQNAHRLQSNVDRVDDWREQLRLFPPAIHSGRPTC